MQAKPAPANQGIQADAPLPLPPSPKHILPLLRPKARPLMSWWLFQVLVGLLIAWAVVDMSPPGYVKVFGKYVSSTSSWSGRELLTEKCRWIVVAGWIGAMVGLAHGVIGELLRRLLSAMGAPRWPRRLLIVVSVLIFLFLCVDDIQRQSKWMAEWPKRSTNGIYVSEPFEFNHFGMMVGLTATALFAWSRLSARDSPGIFWITYQALMGILLVCAVTKVQMHTSGSAPPPAAANLYVDLFDCRNHAFTTEGSKVHVQRLACCWAAFFGLFGAALGLAHGFISHALLSARSQGKKPV